MKSSFSGEDFTPDVNNRTAFVQSLTSSFIKSVQGGHGQFITSDGWGTVFQEEIEKMKNDLGCKNIEFVTDFK